MCKQIICIFDVDSHIAIELSPIVSRQFSAQMPLFSLDAAAIVRSLSHSLILLSINQLKPAPPFHAALKHCIVCSLQKCPNIPKMQKDLVHKEFMYHIHATECHYNINLLYRQK